MLLSLLQINLHIQCNLIKILADFHVKIGRLVHIKLHIKMQRTYSSQNNFEK